MVALGINSIMSKGAGYVRVWHDNAGLSKDLSDKTKKFLAVYMKMESRMLEQHIIPIVSNISNKV